MAYAWNQIAETNTVQHSQSAWQVLLYQYRDGAPGSVPTAKLISDLNLTRGSGSRKNKINYFTFTNITFAIRDDSAYLFGLMSGASDGEFKAVVEKDGSTYFIGNIILLTTVNEFNITNPVIKLKVYDGLKRLLKYDANALTTGRQKVATILHEIISVLDFDIDIKIYYLLKYGGTENGQILTDSNYIYIDDYLSINPAATYYDILLMIAKQLCFEIFQAEGYWIMRQVPCIRYVNMPTYYLYVGTIDASTGAASSTNADLNQAIASTDLMRDPVSFKYKAYDRVEVKCNCHEPKSLSGRHGRSVFLDWKNGFFKSGGDWWTIVDGTPVFGNGILQMAYGDEVYQQSGALSGGERVVITFSVTCIRMIKLIGERLDHTLGHENPLVRIKYDAGATEYYLNRNTNQWDTSADNWSLFGLDMWGIDVDDALVEEYTTNTLNREIEVTLPAGAGYLEVYLYGGGTASGNDYAAEGVQHNFCFVELKREDNHTVETPREVVVSASNSTNIGELRVLKLDLPFHDLDAFINVHFWYSLWDQVELTYYRSIEWISSLGSNEPLMETWAELVLRHHMDNHALDIKLLPGTTCEYNRVVYGDIDGEGTRYYLPVLEKGLLIKDERRFVLFEHTINAASPTVKREYLFNSNAGVNDPGGAPALATSIPSSPAFQLMTSKDDYLTHEEAAFTYSGGLDYYPNSYDLRLVKVTVIVETAFDSSSPTMDVKYDSTIIFNSDNIFLTVAGVYEKYVDQDLSDLKTLSLDITDDGASAGSGRVVYTFRRKFR